MAISSQFADYVTECLEVVGPVRKTRFFGGTGIAQGPVQFGMIMDGTLYLVVDDTSRPKYQQAGMNCFSYLTSKGRVQVRRYFELPEEVLTQPQVLKLWAEESIRIASQKKVPGKKVVRKPLAS